MLGDKRQSQTFPKISKKVLLIVIYNNVRMKRIAFHTKQNSYSKQIENSRFLRAQTQPYKKTTNKRT